MCRLLGEDGVIEGSFGQSGKSKVRIPGDIHCVLVLFAPSGWRTHRVANCFLVWCNCLLTAL